MKNSITLGRSHTNNLKARASPMLNIDADAHVLETEISWSHACNYPETSQ
jgi:hypothetical protein